MAEHSVERAYTVPHTHGPSQPPGWDEDCTVCNPQNAENDEPCLCSTEFTCLASEHDNGLHACVGCGLELDGDDPHDRCDECATPPGSATP